MTREPSACFAFHGTAMCQLQLFCTLQRLAKAFSRMKMVSLLTCWAYLAVDHRGGLQWLSQQQFPLVRVQVRQCLPQELVPLRIQAPVQELPCLRLAQELLHLPLILVRGWDCRAQAPRVPALQHPGLWLSP